MRHTNREHRRAPRALLLALLFATAALALDACGSSTATTSSATTSTAASTGVTVSEPWVRVTPPNAMNAAVYMTLKSAQTDALMGASAPASIASSAELHQTTTSMGSSSESSMTGMKSVMSIPLKAETDVMLAPGGYHIMLTGLKKPITSGEQIPLTLHFQNGPSQTVTVVAREH